jgi:uncharacterized membrane protein YkvA (DUF1232 family)
MGTRFFRYVRDPRVPMWRRFAGLLAVAYFVMPVDVIPDFLPILGWLDDLGVLSGAALFMVREVQRYQPDAGWPKSLDDTRAGNPPLRER